MIGLQSTPINGQCCAGFVVLLHQKCRMQSKELQTTLLKGGNCSRGKQAERRINAASVVAYLRSCILFAPKECAPRLPFLIALLNAL
jgi:hypothetical protein